MSVPGEKDSNSLLTIKEMTSALLAILILSHICSCTAPWPWASPPGENQQATGSGAFRLGAWPAVRGHLEAWKAVIKAVLQPHGSPWKGCTCTQLISLLQTVGKKPISSILLLL